MALGVVRWVWCGKYVGMCGGGCPYIKIHAVGSACQCIGWEGGDCSVISISISIGGVSIIGFTFLRWGVSWLVSGCFEPSKPQRITSGLNTNLILSPSYSFPSQVIIPQVMFFVPIYIPRILNTGTCVRQGDLFYSAGLQRNWC